MTFRDKHWKTKEIAKDYGNRYFNGYNIFETTSGYVVLFCRETKKYKSWKLVESTCG